MGKLSVQRKRERAWELHLKGFNQFKIADELGCTQARVCQLIKEAASQHPVVKLSMEERIALSEARWQQSEDEIKCEIARQLSEGRETVEVLKLPDGSIQQKVTRIKGVDPALLRALSTHHDRRARQLNNQISPDAGVNQVNVAVVQDFLKQADSGKALTATDWNQGQQGDEGTIDV